MDVLIRPAGEADAAEIRRLAAQLGYPMEIDTLLQRLTGIQASSWQAVLIAELDRQVAGWIYLLAGPDLLTGATGEIGGLVVDEGMRGRGVGKALLEAAREWAAGQGCPELRVRSNTAREPYVKAFYLANGYEVVKTQWVLRKRSRGSTARDSRPTTGDR